MQAAVLFASMLASRYRLFSETIQTPKREAIKKTSMAWYSKSKVRLSLQPITLMQYQHIIGLDT